MDVDDAPVAESNGTDTSEFHAATVPQVKKSPIPHPRDAALANHGSHLFWGSGKWCVFHTLHQV